MYGIANATMKHAKKTLNKNKQNGGWGSPFHHYTESMTGVQGKNPKSAGSSLMDKKMKCTQGKFTAAETCHPIPEPNSTT